MKVKLEFDVEDFNNEMDGTFENFLKEEMRMAIREKIKEKIKRNPIFREFIKTKSTEALEKLL